MPELIRRQLSSRQQAGFSGLSPSVAVTEGGVVGMLAPDRPSDPVLLLVSPDRDSSIRVMRRGSGPGELSGAGVIFSRADSFDILDLTKQVLMTVTDDGRLLREDRLGWSDAAILAVHADSVDVMPLFGAARSGVLRRPRTGDGERTLIPPEDPSLASWLARFAPRGVARFLPIFDAHGSQLLLGSGQEYALTLYSAQTDSPLVFGRELPPRYRTDAEMKRIAETLRAASGPGLSKADLEREAAGMKDQQLPHFQYPGGWIDSGGRVWVVGEASDSTFVDFFAAGIFLGRTMLPCPDNRRRIGHSDRWLVLMCSTETATDTSSTVELQLYEVRDTISKAGA